MMQVQPPVSLTARNVLSMMLDSGSIDYATFLTAHLYMSRSVVDRLLLNTGDVESRKRMAHVLFDLRDDIFPEISADLRSVIVYLAVLHLSDYVIKIGRASCRERG